MNTKYFFAALLTVGLACNQAFAAETTKQDPVVAALYTEYLGGRGVLITQTTPSVVVANVDDTVEGFDQPRENPDNPQGEKLPPYNKLALTMALRQWAPFIFFCIENGTDTLEAADKLVANREKIWIHLDGKKIGWINDTEKTITTPVRSHPDSTGSQFGVNTHTVSLSFDEFERLKTNEELLRLVYADTVVWNSKKEGWSGNTGPSIIMSR